MKNNILVLIIFFSHPLWAQVGPSPNAFIYRQEFVRPLEADSYKSEKDRQIVISIRNKINDGSNRYERVTIAVQGGVVSLRGWAASRADINNLLSVVNSIVDVVSVNNYLQVVPDAPPPVQPNPLPYSSNPRQNDTFATPSDRDIVLSIRSYINASHAYDYVYLSVIESRVILEGFVETSAEADSLIRYVTNIPGVKSIKTNLVIRNS